MIRPKLNARETEYDRVNRPKKVTDKTGATDLVTRYEYDDNGNMRHQYDPDGNDTEITYDELNRKKKYIRHLSGSDQGPATELTTEYQEYDGEGNLLSLYDPNGSHFTYQYDNLNRRTLAAYPDDSVATEYDPNGNVVKITDQTGITENTYDNLDRLTGSTSRGFALSYEYDPNGNRLKVTSPSGKTTYTYDSRNRLKTVTEDGVRTTAYTYTPNGKEKKISYPNGAETEYSFYPTDRIGSVTNRGPGDTVISQFVYEYDANGNRRTATENTDLTTYTANNLNQYTELSGAKSATPLHDDDGNITDYKNMKFSWNAENQMISAEPKNPAEGDKKTEYLYDYMGRRARKRIFVYSSGAWTKTTEKLFVYDGWNLVKEITKTVGNSSSDKFYVWGLDLSQSLQGAGGIGGLVCAVSAGEVRHFFSDGNGNVGQVVNADGSIAAHYEYDPFGNAIIADGDYAAENPFRFSTKYFDAETGLYYYGFRDYSAELGRWWSRDPLGESGGLNLYSFVHNDTPNQFDKLGLALSDKFGFESEECADKLSRYRYWLAKHLVNRGVIEKTTEQISELSGKMGLIDRERIDFEVWKYRYPEGYNKIKKGAYIQEKEWKLYLQRFERERLVEERRLLMEIKDKALAEVDFIDYQVRYYREMYNRSCCNCVKQIYCAYGSSVIGIGFDIAGLARLSGGIALTVAGLGNNMLYMAVCENAYQVGIASSALGLVSYFLDRNGYAKTAEIVTFLDIPLNYKFATFELGDCLK